MMKKKNGVTKRTWDRKVRQFAMEGASAFRYIEAFVKSHCKHAKSEMARLALLDELCSIVDRNIEISCDILDWCHRNGVSISDFASDVCNHRTALANDAAGNRTA